MSLTITDLFCGAGGSSQGMEAAGGTLVMAANHWQLAVETHAQNFPHADHDTANISQADPRRYPRTDILWASPECTNHSQAKGSKRQTAQLALGEEPLPDEAADRSRATMWDVVRFAEHHRYPVLLLDGAPQLRDRMYWACHRTALRCPDLELRPASWCPRCDGFVEGRQAWKRPEQRWGRYRQQYIYLCSKGHQVEPLALPAAHAIDWALPGERIGDRARPLADKTRRRIEEGIRRHARPLHLEATGNQYDSMDPRHAQHGQPGAYLRAWPIDEALRTLHTDPSKALAYPPLLVPVEGRDGKTASTAHAPLRTQTARNETALTIPPLVGALRTHSKARPAGSDPLMTVCAGTQHQFLVTPMLCPAGGTWNDTASPVDEPMRTRTTRDTEAIVVPPGMIMRNNTARGQTGQMSTRLDEPLRTLTTTGHQSLVTWARLYGYDTGHLRPLNRPMPTQTTIAGDALLHGDHELPDVDDCYFRMLEPHEIQAGMAFAGDYRVLGNKREQVRQLGNAVTPPAAALLLDRMTEILGARA